MAEELEEASVEEQEDTGSYEMTDEDFLAQPEPTDEVVEEESEEASEEVVEEEESDTEEQGVTDEEESEDTPESSEDANTEVSTEKGDIDYKSQVEAYMAPFKANGKLYTPKSMEDLKHLQEKGINYEAKMNKIKPALRTIKMLEKNDISEEQLNYLIDLHNKVPEAISKLVKDSGTNPLDIDVENTENYKPNTYTVDDKEVELDTVLEELQHTESFKTTVDIISNKWDESSKTVILNEPNIIKVINDHVGNGIYDKITTVIDSERAMGRLGGLSDLEAYKQVGDSIEAKGGFAKPQATQENKPKATVVKDTKLKAKKLAASTSKRTTSKTTTKPLDNTDSLSDAEFEKLFNI